MSLYFTALRNPHYPSELRCRSALPRRFAIRITFGASLPLRAPTTLRNPHYLRSFAAAPRSSNSGFAFWKVKTTTAIRKTTLRSGADASRSNNSGFAFWKLEKTKMKTTLRGGLEARAPITDFENRFLSAIKSQSFQAKKSQNKERT